MGTPGKAGTGAGGGTAGDARADGSVTAPGVGHPRTEPPPTTHLELSPPTGHLELSPPTGPVLSRAVQAGGVGQDQEWQEAINRLPATSALLRVDRGARGARFLLNTDRTTAGRHLGSDIFLDHATVSRSHAVFERRGTEFRVHDNGSLNGTYVNGERIETALLRSGDRMQIGKFGMTFYQNLAARSPQDPGSPPPPAAPGGPVAGPVDPLGPGEPVGPGGPGASGGSTVPGAPGGAARRSGGGWWSESRSRLRAWLEGRRQDG